MAKRIQQSYVDAGKRAVICSADDYFIDSQGRYCWDGARLPEAHGFCKEKSESHMNRVRAIFDRKVKYRGIELIRMIKIVKMSPELAAPWVKSFAHSK